MKLLARFLARGSLTPDTLRPRAWRAARQAWSFLAGLAAALILSYVLYRVALPSKPFIYVAF